MLFVSFVSFVWFGVVVCRLDEWLFNRCAESTQEGEGFCMRGEGEMVGESWVSVMMARRRVKRRGESNRKRR